MELESIKHEANKIRTKKAIIQIKKMMKNATLYDQNEPGSKIEEWKKGQLKFSGPYFKVSGIYLQTIWDFLNSIEKELWNSIEKGS